MLNDTTLPAAVGARFERGVRRLLLGGAMLRPPALTPEEARDRLAALPAAERDHLRELVDWVEEYENALQRIRT